MTIVYRNGRFEAITTFQEKDIPKAARFRWDPAVRVWFTNFPENVLSIIQYADDQVRTMIQDGQNKKASAVEASRATDAQIDLPCPQGLSYLGYQKAGIAYGLSHNDVLIADEPGLGKTIQALGVINADPSVKSVLIVCPASLKINWQREARKWLTRPMTVAIANGSWPEAEVVILNYDILKKWDAKIKAGTWDMLILDEAHYLKNPKAQRTQQVLGSWNRDPQKVVPAIPARRRLALTGTPIVNRPVELWPLLHAMDSQNLGKFWKGFVTRYCDGHENNWGWDVSGASHLDELQEKLRANLMVRRLKADVLKDLPAKVRTILPLPCNASQGKAVKAELAAMVRHEEQRAILAAAVELAKAQGAEAYKAAVLALQAAERVAFNEISKVRHETAVAKIPSVVEHLQGLVDDDGLKVVVMAHHHDVVNALSAAFGDRAVVLTGETSMTDRQVAVDRFQTDDSVRLFIGSIQAAGVGITLTASATVVFAELDWTPGNVSQAEDRCHRIGQNDTVMVTHLVLDGSLDQRMAELLVEKQNVIDQALDNQIVVDTVLVPKVEQTLPAERPAPIPEEPSAENGGLFGLRTKSRLATQDLLVSQLETMAARVTPEQIKAIKVALLSMTESDPDYAQVKNGVGFNKADSHIGHGLAGMGDLNARQAVLAQRLLRKYHGQLGAERLADCGVVLDA